MLSFFENDENNKNFSNDIPLNLFNSHLKDFPFHRFSSKKTNENTMKKSPQIENRLKKDSNSVLNNETKIINNPKPKNEIIEW